MKKHLVLLCFALFIMCVTAQNRAPQSGAPTQVPFELQAVKGKPVAGTTRGTLKILSNEQMGEMVTSQWNQRSLWGDASKAALGVLNSSFISASTSLIELGVDQVYKLATRSKRRHNSWLEVVRKQNQWSDSITAVNDVKDFYSEISHVGAMDPSGMLFNGFDYRQENEDGLAYHIHCSVDISEEGIREITNHGNFCLVIDTLYINPYLCNIPNTDRESRKFYSFAFEDGASSVSYTLGFVLTSSWMNQAIEYFRNQKIGEFSIALNLQESNLNATDDNGHKVFSYVRGDKNFKQQVPTISGKSLIVPRSYIGRVADETNKFRDVWSTGEYNVKLTLSETRRIDDKIYWNDPKKSPNYWKDDYSRRVNSVSRTLYNWYIQSFGENGETIVTKIISASAQPYIKEAANFLFDAQGAPASATSATAKNAGASKPTGSTGQAMSAGANPGK